MNQRRLPRIGVHLRVVSVAGFAAVALPAAGQTLVASFDTDVAAGETTVIGRPHLVQSDCNVRVPQISIETPPRHGTLVLVASRFGAGDTVFGRVAGTTEMPACPDATVKGVELHYRADVAGVADRVMFRLVYDHVPDRAIEVTVDITVEAE